MTAIRRAFADLSHGQMHYRRAGAGGEPLVLIHPSPTSSRQMVRMIADCATDRLVVAPDTPGNGDSEPLPQEQPTVADLAAAYLALLDALGLEQVRVYGMHTGAAIAAELAILAPDRMTGVVLDGLSDFHGAALDEVLARYAPRFEPDHDGAMLARVFEFCRDQFLFFPWYVRDRQARRDSGLPPDADLYGWVIEVLKAHGSYHRNYHAAFRWDARTRLPQVACPLLVTCAANDPLHDATQALAGELALSFRTLPRFDAPDHASQRRALLGEAVPSGSSC